MVTLAENSKKFQRFVMTQKFSLIPFWIWQAYICGTDPPSNFYTSWLLEIHHPFYILESFFSHHLLTLI